MKVKDIDTISVPYGVTRLDEMSDGNKIRLIEFGLLVFFVFYL